MVLPNENINVENSVGQSEEFQIKADEKLFRLLSDNVYADKISAGIRELACNAYDAHVEVGSTQKFQVTIPSEDKPEFRVRDFGTGLSPTQMSMYTTYGMSSKEDSNAYIGAFGIGAKAPFAYTNIFNVTSYQNGKAYYYTMYIERGTPKKTLLAETETTEPDGLEVFYTVKPEDISDFINKSLRILKWLKDSIEVINAPNWWLDDFESSNTDWEPSPYLGEGFGEIGLHVTDRLWGDAFKVVQGNVLYSISSEECKEAFGAFVDKQDYGFKVKEEDVPEVGFDGIVKVPNGTFMPQPSRERLSFTPDTKIKLGSILYMVYQEKVVNRIRDMFRKAQNSYPLLFKEWVDAPILIKENKKFKDLYFKGYNGLSFKKWQTSIAKNIRVLKLSSNEEQLHVSNLKETLMNALYSGKYPVYKLSEGTSIPLEKKCRIIEDVTKEHSLNRVIAYIIPNNSEIVLTDSDRARLRSIEDLPPCKKETREKWASASVKTRKKRDVVTVFCPGYSDVERTCNAFDKQDKLKFMFWVAADKAYEFTVNKDYYDIDHVKDRKAFTIRYGFLLAEYIYKMGERDKTTYDERPVVVLLPKDHPYRAILTPLEDAIKEGTEFYIDSYEESIGWESDYSERRYKDFVKDLVERGLLDRLDLPQETVNKYKAWAADGFTLGNRKESIKELSFVPLSQAYKDKVAAFKRDSDTDAHVLRFSREIIYPLKDGNFPLVNYLINNYYGTDFDIVNDLVDYVENKLNKEKN